MNNIPQTQFTTEIVAEQHRFGVWRESISVLFQCDLEKESSSQKPELFEGHIEAFMFDQVMLAHTRSNAAHYVRKATAVNADGIDMVMIQLFILGEVQFRCGGTVTNAQSGDIIVFDLNQESRNFNTSYEHLSVLFPRELIDYYVPNISQWHGQILPRNQSMTTLLKRHLMSLHDMAPNISNESSLSLQRSLLELTSSAFNAANKNISQFSEVISVTLLQEIKKFIRVNLAQPNLSLNSICTEFGLSRARLYRATDPLGGVMNYIRSQRLKRSMKELQSPEFCHISISELAFKWGFSDAGTFTRSFKQCFGMLPKDARKLATESHQILKKIDNSETNRDYEIWVRSLAG